ncbi:PREDICTED: COP9 signalosome complex subunit 7-like isoform X1 [Populus euphratica]|uniref:COP9 signalosome complex subunit 7-like isoform X1 n=1 Tax=Populus euphratica TaxID=75702 RepID=A0AAJ6VGY0_POPEU|nr:PREDICTED: COP9 signalosome complex subunit 7-like isoform X1 [Populus euphratica]
MSEYLWVLNPRGNNGMLPKLSPDQFLKLKQLTVLTLSATNKGIVKGKLNQLGRCYELQFAAGRDLMHGQLGSMIDTLGICWCAHVTTVACNFQSKQGLCFWENVDGFGYLGGLMEQEKDLIRSRRRRSQHNYSRGRPVHP